MADEMILFVAAALATGFSLLITYLIYCTDVLFDTPPKDDEVK